MSIPLWDTLNFEQYRFSPLLIELHYQFHVFEMLLDEPPIVGSKQQGYNC